MKIGLHNYYHHCRDVIKHGHSGPEKMSIFSEIKAKIQNFVKKSSISEFYWGFWHIRYGNDNSNIHSKFQDHTINIYLFSKMGTFDFSGGNHPPPFTHRDPPSLTAYRKGTNQNIDEVL